MDKIAQKANSARSLRGGSFEDKLEDLFSEMKTQKIIKKFNRKPKIFDGEFNPDFIIEMNNGEIISIDGTTTARTDRIRGKQWDAYGTKKYFVEKHNKNIKSFVVVQDTDTSQREKDNFRRGGARCKLPHTALDDVISVDKLVEIIKEQSS